MHHNILSFWQKQENLPADHADKLSPRVNRLLLFLFEQWRNKPAWPEWDEMGHLFDLYSGKDRDEVRSLPVAIRKAMAVKLMLQKLSSPESERKGLMLIHPDEVIVGTLPPYSVGQGKELMRYLTEEEAMYYEIRFLNEWSPFGHIVPNHEKVLKNGIDSIIRDCEQKLSTANEKQQAFLRSVIIALEGVLAYADNYASAAERKAEIFKDDDPTRYAELMLVAQRLKNSPRNPARNFHEALQCIHIMHCALHYTGEIVPIGRLDQLLIGFYEKDLSAGTLTEEMAKELIECFWIKLDEKVVLNRRHLEDRFTSSDGALLGTGAASNFDQGALANQWMQQITIGGVHADNEAKQRDACNAVTMLCLAAARRLPLNSPTLDLRVHSKTPARVLEAAAQALLSGGAHPVLLNDDKLIPALHQKSGGYVELKSARNYACDGCYETLFAGETEFSFGFVAALDVLEKTLNSGAGFAFSGATYLRGSKGSWRTRPASQIKSFEEFWEILRHHVLIGCHKFFNGILSQYGIKENVSPSPLLSALIDGCIETGRDLSGGGARYHLFSPLMTGISTAADSLFVIQHLVFETKAITLEELVACLRTNWGQNAEVTGLKLPLDRVNAIRTLCMQQPRFGHGHIQVDQLAWKLIEVFHQCLEEVKKSPLYATQWLDLANRYDVAGKKFEILIAPGVGTFEQYVFGGSFAGATPDGRMAFDPIASDLSPSPLFPDQDPITASKRTRLADSLKSYTDESIHTLSDGAPADLNIPEDFPLDSLTEILKAFAKGKGSNVMTITVANPETFRNAAANPDQYDLVRVRMGGWTEFFITLFPAHKSQHERRPVFMPE